MRDLVIVVEGQDQGQNLLKGQEDMRDLEGILAVIGIAIFL